MILFSLQLVAPLVGAWIEICTGLFEYRSNEVAPLVGAWIEIAGSPIAALIAAVAPLVGAWIEISYLLPLHAHRLSLPLWERGLKLPFLLSSGIR